MSRQRIARLTIPAVLGSLLLLGACGSTDEEPGSSGATSPSPASPAASTPAGDPAAIASSDPAPEPDQDLGTIVAITVKNGRVSPEGKLVKVSTGSPVTFRVQSDSTGSLHVHSTPEHELSYPVGASQKTLRFERPGVVEVEDHDLDLLVVKLQVS